MSALWTSQQVAEFLGIPAGTLDQWSYRKIGPKFYKIGRHRRYDETDVLAWLETRRQGGGEA